MSVDLYDLQEVKECLDQALFNFFSEQKFYIINRQKNLSSVLGGILIALSIILFAKAERLDLHRELMLKCIGASSVVYLFYWFHNKFVIKESVVKFRGKGLLGIETFNLTSTLKNSPVYLYEVTIKGKKVSKKLKIKVEDIFWSDGDLDKETFNRNIKTYIDTFMKNSN